MPQIEHVFVLMLENRSFDHMLGFSEIGGTDAVDGKPTVINGLSVPAPTNTWKGETFTAGPPAVDPMAADPYHEFSDVLEQLCGAGIKYPPGGPYPAIDHSGFVSNFGGVAIPGQHPSTAAPGDVMKCFGKGSLPVLTALAQEFAVCDSWFCSLPGPTWPNRLFALAGSSGGLDHSPTSLEAVDWQTISGFACENGNIFHPRAGSLKWRIYAGNKLFTLAHALKGVHIWDITRYSKFAGDVSNPSYDAQFTWIEPNYGHVTSDYLGGNSQHPLDGVTGGEALIKSTYEAIRNSPLWESSMLIVTWDEHGGFFDHADVPAAPDPRDIPQVAGANKEGFVFDIYGPRVPALVVSPLIPRNIIDHRTYDHTSILATAERLFSVPPLTARDAVALDLRSLASLPAARTDTPASISLQPQTSFAHSQVALDTLETEAPQATHADAPIETNRSLPGFLCVAGLTDAELPPQNLALDVHKSEFWSASGHPNARRRARLFRGNPPQDRRPGPQR